ncbi:Uncharacterised protein [uncultured archaeon]|nr:Uncharacterised protein [uncultured archaeon]
MEDNWRTILRPGYFGKKREEICEQFNKEYGKNNWRLMWEFGGTVVPFYNPPEISACDYYEDGYFMDSFKRQDLWQELCKTAKEVYDHEESNINAGLDYNNQEPKKPVHLQDITIRRVVKKRGWSFSGNNLIQIRSHSDKWGKLLSPGRVPFHIPEIVYQGEIQNISSGRIWYDQNSIEWAYQQAKILQIKD